MLAMEPVTAQQLAPQLFRTQRMPTLFTFLALVAVAGQLFVQDAVAAQVTPDFHDHKMTNLSEAVSASYQAAKQIYGTFLLGEASKDAARLSRLIGSIKEHKHAIQLLRIEIGLELGTVEAHSFEQRLWLEFFLIQTKGHDALLTDIAKELLAESHRVATYPSYVDSETLLVARELLQARNNELVPLLNQAEQLLREAFSRNGAGAIDQATKQKVEALFQKLFTINGITRNELQSDYYRELERIRLQNGELSLETRMEFAVGIDMQNYLMEYVRTYEQLFMRITG